MAIKWNPTGFLDVSTEPTDLPEQSDGSSTVSDALTSCVNLRLDRDGFAYTRRGSRIISSGVPNCSKLVENAGHRYAFCSSGIYRDEVSLLALSASIWQALVYRLLSQTDETVYATDGTYRKKVEGGTVYEWGIDAPDAPTTVSSVEVAFMHSWEDDEAFATHLPYKEANDYAYTYSWEAAQVSGELYWAWPVAGNCLRADYGYASGYWATSSSDGGTMLLDETDPWASAAHWTLSTTGYEYCFAWELNQLNGTSTDVVSYDRSPFWFDAHEGDTQFGVRITYRRKDSNGAVLCESNPSDAVSSLPGNSFILQWTAPTDAQVTHVAVYRTMSGGATYYLDSEYDVADLEGAALLPDSALGLEVAYDHDRPPAGITALFGPNFNGYCFALVGNELRYSKPQEPEYWPALYALEVSPPDEPLTAGVLLHGVVHCLTRRKVYQIQGTGPESFFPTPFDSYTGAVGPTAALAVQGTGNMAGVFHFGSNAIYLWSGVQDLPVSQRYFRPTFEGVTVNGVPGINLDAVENVLLWSWEGKIYGAYPADGTYPDTVMVTDSTTGKSMIFDYGRAFTAVCEDATNQRLLAVDTDGTVWQLEALDCTDDDGTAITGEIQSKSFSDQVRYYFPRWARYDVEVSENASATASILLGEVVKQTHAITSRVARKRHIATCTGKRLAVRIDFSGPVKVYQVEVE